MNAPDKTFALREKGLKEKASIANCEDRSKFAEEFEKIRDQIDDLFFDPRCTLGSYEVKELDGHDLARFSRTNVPSD